MTNAEEARVIANKVLERVNADPDDDLATLAREVIRADYRDIAAGQQMLERIREELRDWPSAGLDHEIAESVRRIIRANCAAADMRDRIACHMLGAFVTSESMITSLAHRLERAGYAYAWADAMLEVRNEHINQADESEATSS